MATLLSLPEEVLLRILAELSVVEVLSCSEVCTRLQCLVESSRELQYRIDLFAAGSVEIPGNGLILAERASLLQSHVEGWASMAVKRQEKIFFSPGYRSLWAYTVVSGGVFAGVGSNSLAIAKLPSALDPGGEASLLPHGTLFVEALFVNPQEDGLLMVHTIFGQPCLGLVFWTLDGLPHPDAAAGLEYRQSLADRHSQLKLLASDLTKDYFGILVESLIGMKPVREIMIWQFRTGAVVSHFRPIKKHYTSFDFLSETEFVVCNAATNPMTIDVYHINASEQTLECLHSLQLPTLAARAVCHLTVIPNRSPRAVPRAKSSSRGTSFSRLPFVTRPELRMICIRLRVVSAGRHMSTASYLVFIPTSALLRPRGKHPTDCATDIPPSVPWSSWGPDSSRWFDYSWTHARVRGAPAVHGTRAAITVPSAYMGSLSYRFLDFNPLALKREALDPVLCCHQIVRSPSVMEADGFWTEDVESRLPYRELFKTRTFNDLVSLFLDDERIIAMKSVEVDRSFLEVYVL